MFEIEDLEDKEYVCIRGFCVDKVDEDGFTEEENAFYIEKGSHWVCSGKGFICGDIRLERDECWIEVDIDSLEDDFELIK